MSKRQRKPKLLELFAGTGSVGKVVKRMGYDIISVDLSPKFKPDYTVNIMKFDYKQFKIGEFKVIWASPPCTEYSRAKTRGIRDIKGANKIVRRTLKIIAYLQPEVYFMENPQTGLLKNQRFMKNIPFIDIDYCAYSNWGYKKSTRIWTNIANEINAKRCAGKNKCKNMRGTRHKCHVGSGNFIERKLVTREEAYRVPPRLVRCLFNVI